MVRRAETDDMNPDHLHEIHQRWAKEPLNRDSGDAGYPDSWYFEQCGGCVHWIALGGSLGDDWGVCSGASSAFGGRVRFEHDGCDEFIEDHSGFGVHRG